MRDTLDTAFVLLMAVVYGIMALVILVLTSIWVPLWRIADWIEGEE